MADLTLVSEEGGSVRRLRPARCAEGRSGRRPYPHARSHRQFTGPTRAAVEQWYSVLLVRNHQMSLFVWG